MTGPRIEVPGTGTPRMAVGPIEDRWPDVNRIVVFRGGGLGDVLMAMPAIDALAAAYPDAEIVLVCTPFFSGLMSDRPSAVTRCVTMPPVQGVYEPDEPLADVDAERRRFDDQMTGSSIDLGVQLHGDGKWANPFLLNMKPRWTVGTATREAEPLTRSIPYRSYQSEVMRCLEVVGLAGAPPVTLKPRISVTAADLKKAREVLPPSDNPTIAFHPGARDPCRRWPASNFATVIRHCVNQGGRAVLVGSPAERSLLSDVAEMARRAPGDGSNTIVILDDIDLSTLCGVLACSDVVVGNDSGVRHLAGAVESPSVGIFWIGNMIKFSPFGRSRDRALISWTMKCPVCGSDWPSRAGSSVPREQRGTPMRTPGFSRCRCVARAGHRRDR